MENREPISSFRTWGIVLLVLGSPIWLSLLVAAAAIVFSLYIVLWSLIISLWAVEASLLVTAFGVVLSGIVFLFSETAAAGVAMIGSAIVCAGLSIFLFFACRAVTKGTCTLTKNIVISIKNRFTGKEAE